MTASRHNMFLIYFVFLHISAICHAKNTSTTANTDPHACGVTQRNESKCCSGYRLVKGKCTGCIGYFGRDCSSPCKDGYYGASCLSPCNCQKHQLCNRFVGCLNNDSVIPGPSTDPQPDNDVNWALLLISCLGSCIITCLVEGLIIYMCLYTCRGARKKVTITGKAKNPEKTDVEVNDNDILYSCVRESKMTLDEENRSLGKVNENNNDEYQKGKLYQSKTMERLGHIKNRIESNDYNHLKFSRNPDVDVKHPKNEYNYLDARFVQNVNNNDVMDDVYSDGYVSLDRKKTRFQPVRRSKSCSNLLVMVAESIRRPYSVVKHQKLDC